MTYEEMLKDAANYPDEMTESERKKRYAAGEEVDHIPIHLSSGETAAPTYGMTMKEFRDDVRKQIELVDRWKADFGIGGMGASFIIGLRGVGEALGAKIVSPENSIEYIADYPLKDYGMLADMDIDPASSPVIQKMADQADEIMRILDRKVPVKMQLPGPMTAACSVRIPDLFLRDLLKNKANAHALLEKCVEWELRIAAYVKERYGSVGISLADPCSAATLVSKKMYLEFSKPYQAALMDGIKEITGSVPGVHICGKTRPYWTDLAEIGMTNFSVDNCEDLEELKQVLGDRVAISGNVPPVDVMLNGTIDDVIECCVECMEKGSDSPCGYELRMGCGMAPFTPKRNLEAFLYAGRKYGRGARKGHRCKGLEGGPVSWRRKSRIIIARRTPETE